MQIEFEIKSSQIHGKGLYTRRALPKRRKIGELGGEKISLREARRRVRDLKIIAIVEFNDGTAIDSTVGGNEFRFINHSCKPNTFMRLIAGRCEFYTLRPVRAGEELTCNYGETQHEGSVRCECGAKGCIGAL